MGRNVKKPVRRRGAKRQAERRGGRKKKRVAFDVVTTTILIVAICVFAFSLFQLVKMLIPYYSGGKEYDKLKDKAITIQTTKDSEDTSEARFKVDFDVLLQENPDTVAWIRFDEPSIISYPVVKSADNKEYLTKTFTESDNKLGAIFMDMRNTSDFSDKNTMIYGHNMKNGSMFNNIKSYTDQSFADEHPYIYIYLPDGTVSQYKVVVGHIISETSVLYNTHIVDTASFVQEMVKTSSIKVDFDQSQVQSVITLSTCTSAGSESGKRNVVHAILQRKGIDPVKEKMENQRNLVFFVVNCK